MAPGSPYPLAGLPCPPHPAFSIHHWACLSTEVQSEGGSGDSSWGPTCRTETRRPGNQAEGRGAGATRPCCILPLPRTDRRDPRDRMRRSWNSSHLGTSLCPADCQVFKRFIISNVGEVVRKAYPSDAASRKVGKSSRRAEQFDNSHQTFKSTCPWTQLVHFCVFVS